MESKDLTYEWQEYDGDYCKIFQDIKLKDGSEVFYCYPNAGYFHPLERSQSSVPLPENLVTHVRKTSKEYMDSVHKRWEAQVLKIDQVEAEIKQSRLTARCKKGHSYVKDKAKDHTEVWVCKNCGRKI
jgi:rubrerythrin